ncbi:MAG: hypothetical protein ACI83P_000942 [Janthinobacterium sp.]|jgi:hypothetical protein
MLHASCHYNVQAAIMFKLTYQRADLCCAAWVWRLRTRMKRWRRLP